MTSDEDRHVRKLGALVADLQSMEFFLRGFLSTVHQADANGLLLGMPQHMVSLKVGQNVPENFMTDYRTLGQLVDQYNAYVDGRDASLMLDKETVVLRDALAHGRVFQEDGYQHFQLLKFDKPTHGQVRVTFSQTMDDAWFKGHTSLVIDQCRKIHEACRKFAQTMIVTDFPSNL